MARSALLVQEIRARTQWGSSSSDVAHNLGLSRVRLSQIKAGSSIGPKAAARILAKLREEDLALADKIEAELVQSWRDELRKGEE